MENILESYEYSFLNTEPNLKGNLMFLCYWGSLAYGTSNTNSDIDIRGVTLNTKGQLLGLDEFSHYKDANTDTTIYGFKRFIELLLSSNPNAIEMLGCRASDYLYMTKYGEEIIRNRKIFLSQEVAVSFSQYAFSQLTKMKKAIAKDRSTEEQKMKYLITSLRYSISNFNKKYTDMDKIKLEVRYDDSDGPRVVADVEMQGYPIKQFNGIISDIRDISKSYNEINSRNKKKDDIHVNKHAMHLVRILLTGIDILELGDIVTHREKDLDILLPIRYGQYMDSNGRYKDEFFELVDSLGKRLEYAMSNSSIPKSIDKSIVNQFIIELNESRLRDLG